MRDMISFLWASTSLALRGALVQDLPGTLLRVALAALGGTLVGVGALLIGSPLWLAALLGGLVGGIISPYLLRNIKIA